jgi:hypothetical protein
LIKFILMADNSKNKSGLMKYNIRSKTPLV